MSNFKSGSGNLDFSSDDEDTTESSTDASEPRNKGEEKTTTASSDQPNSTVTEGSPDTEPESERAPPKQAPSEKDSPGDDYPYFVRRSNVGDERDTRLEIHVRDRVAENEAEFRSELAEQLGTNEISKTDAREFALIAAFQHPEQVAELMEQEGFGVLD